jgi:hypothetical protein
VTAFPSGSGQTFNGERVRRHASCMLEGTAETAAAPSGTGAGVEAERKYPVRRLEPTTRNVAALRDAAEGRPGRLRAVRREPRRPSRRARARLSATRERLPRGVRRLPHDDAPAHRRGAARIAFHGRCPGPSDVSRVAGAANREQKVRASTGSVAPPARRSRTSVAPSVQFAFGGHAPARASAPAREQSRRNGAVRVGACPARAARELRRAALAAPAPRRGIDALHATNLGAAERLVRLASSGRPPEIAASWARRCDPPLPTSIVPPPPPAATAVVPARRHVTRRAELRA